MASLKPKSWKDKRNYELKYVEEHNNTVRLFNVDQNSKKKHHTALEKGFRFSKIPNDIKCLPEFYMDNEDLYGQFYANLVNTKMFQVYSKEIENFFEPNNKENIGCYIKTPDGRFNSAHKQFTEFDEEYESLKFRTLHYNTSFALEKIDEGEVLIKEKAAILCKHPSCVCNNKFYFECAYCTNSILKYFVCHNCNIEIYCSEECRELAFHEYHSFECCASKCHFFARKDSLWVAFRMLTIGTLYRFDTSKPNTYRRISHISDCRKDINVLEILRKTTVILIYLKNYTNYFTCPTIVECFPKLTIKQRLIKIGSILFTHVIQAENSMIYFPNEMISLTTNTLGNHYGTPSLLLGATKFGHSCDPNAALIFVSGHYYIKALRDIHPNEEITMNVISLDEDFYGRYKKPKCTCTKCLNVKYTGKVYICYYCNKNKLQLWHSPTGTIWRCTKCDTFEPCTTMDAKVSSLTTLFEKIRDMDSTTYIQNGYICNVYLEFYDTFVKNQYPEYLFVLQKGYTLAIANVDVGMARHYARLIFDCAENNLHKYSVRKIDIFASLVNSILLAVFSKEARLKRVMKVARSAMVLLEPLCTFYMMEQQFVDLNVALNYVNQTYFADFDIEDAITECDTKSDILLAFSKCL